MTSPAEVETVPIGVQRTEAQTHFPQAYIAHLILRPMSGAETDHVYH